MGIKRVLAGFGVDAGCVGELVAIVCPFGERAPGGSADGSSARVSFRPLSEWGSVRDQASFRLPLVRERCWTDVLPTDLGNERAGTICPGWSARVGILRDMALGGAKPWTGAVLLAS